jgi:NO-binding membrane sensor protein with MHYT domain
MLAFHLPMPVGYYWPTVLLSLLLAIVASVGALYLVSRYNVPVFYTVPAGIMLGGGVAGLHYVDMSAMRMAAVHRFDAPWLRFPFCLRWRSLLPACGWRSTFETSRGRRFGGRSAARE